MINSYKHARCVGTILALTAAWRVYNSLRSFQRIYISIFPLTNHLDGNILYIPVAQTCARVIVRDSQYEFPSDDRLKFVLGRADENNNKEVTFLEARALDHRICHQTKKGIEEQKRLEVKEITRQQVR